MNLVMLGLWAAISSAYPAVTLAGALDAPVEQKPTVRSEILKGFNAAPRCSDMLEPSGMDDCYSEIHLAYGIAHNDARAFDLGLDIREWQQADTFMQTAEASPSNSISGDWLRVARLPRAKTRFDILEKAAALHLTDMEAFGALHLPPETIERWKSTAPPAAN